MVDVALELALVDDLVDLLADASDATIRPDLADDELVVARLPELATLVDRLDALRDDLLELERA